jgi:hypothetical protein
MQRQIGVVSLGVVKDGSIMDLHPNWSVAQLCGYRQHKTNAAVIINGAGMDMGYAIVHQLAIALYDDGSALKHRWLYCSHPRMTFSLRPAAGSASITIFLMNSFGMGGHQARRGASGATISYCRRNNSPQRTGSAFAFPQRKIGTTKGGIEGGTMIIFPICTLMAAGRLAR